MTTSPSTATRTIVVTTTGNASVNASGMCWAIHATHRSPGTRRRRERVLTDRSGSRSSPQVRQRHLCCRPTLGGASAISFAPLDQAGLERHGDSLQVGAGPEPLEQPAHVTAHCAVADY